VVITTPPTPLLNIAQEYSQAIADYVSHPHIYGTESMEISRLPPEDWIAVVCGASKAQDEDAEDLPEGFYIAPKDVYMPDLTAVADVLLRKLVGSPHTHICVFNDSQLSCRDTEALDSRTPFVYVPRPLFIEEHGLRLRLERDGVGVELFREDHEGGNWATAVERAWSSGSEAKRLKRLEGALGCVQKRGC
jgi:hypothetical protein